MKKLFSLLLALLVCMTAAGCGVNAPAETTAPTDPTEPPVLEIPYPDTPDARPYSGVVLRYATVLGGEEPRAAVLLQAAEFFTLRTGAEVEISWLGSSEEAFAAGDADIYELTGQALQNGAAYAYDLTELAAASDYDAHSYGLLRTQITDRCGFLAGIPAQPHIRALYFNRDAFDACGIDAAPADWDMWLAACSALTREGFSPLALDSRYAPEAAWLWFCSVLGADRAMQSGWAESETAIDAAQKLIDFLAAGYLAVGCPAEYPAGQNKLALSNAAMVFGPDTLCAEVREAALAEMDFGVIPLPGGGAAADADVLALHKNTGQAQAAFDFILLLTCGEFDQLRADVTGTIPADPANRSPIAGARAILENAREMPPVPAGVEEVLLRLWLGKYKDGAAFASAMDRKLPDAPEAPST